MKSTFGQTIRNKRMEQKITLRKFSKMVGLSPTFISNVETDKVFPSQEKIKLMVEILLGKDADRDIIQSTYYKWLALKGEIDQEIKDIILKYPHLICTMLKLSKGLNKSDWFELVLSTTVDKKEKDNADRKF